MYATPDMSPANGSNLTLIVAPTCRASCSTGTGGPSTAPWSSLPTRTFFSGPARSSCAALRPHRCDATLTRSFLRHTGRDGGRSIRARASSSDTRTPSAFRNQTSCSRRCLPSREILETFLTMGLPLAVARRHSTQAPPPLSLISPARRRAAAPQSKGSSSGWPSTQPRTRNSGGRFGRLRSFFLSSLASVFLSSSDRDRANSSSPRSSSESTVPPEQTDRSAAERHTICSWLSMGQVTHSSSHTHLHPATSWRWHGSRKPDCRQRLSVRLRALGARSGARGPRSWASPLSRRSRPRPRRRWPRAAPEPLLRDARDLPSSGAAA
jgi:hypothetical protein